jgi:hypothetical protein
MPVNVALSLSHRVPVVTYEVSKLKSCGWMLGSAGSLVVVTGASVEMVAMKVSFDEGSIQSAR